MRISEHDICEYDVREPYDPSTQGLVTVLNGENLIPGDAVDLTWFDGVVLYLLGADEQVYECHLSTAWDIATATFFGAVDECDIDWGETEMAWNDDGTKLYTVGEFDHE